MLHNHRQPSASGRLTVTQMCHMKGEVGLMTLKKCFCLHQKKTPQPSQLNPNSRAQSNPCTGLWAAEWKGFLLLFYGCFSNKFWVIRKKFEYYSTWKVDVSLHPPPNSSTSHQDLIRYKLLGHQSKLILVKASIKTFVGLDPCSLMRALIMSLCMATHSHVLTKLEILRKYQLFWHVYPKALGNAGIIYMVQWIIQDKKNPEV